MTNMRVGVILPTFTDTFDAPLRVLREIEDAGFDGAFVYDHLWPMHHRELPAISAYAALGALSAHRNSIALGTLVARVGVVAPSILVRELQSIFEATGGAFVAGIGTADNKSAEEYLGYGLAFPEADERRAELRTVCVELIRNEVPVWVGGGARQTNEIARELGATLNLWGAPVDRVRAEILEGPVSWAGKLPKDPAVAGALVADLADSGATWSVFEWPGSLEPIVAACALAQLA